MASLPFQTRRFVLLPSCVSTGALFAVMFAVAGVLFTPMAAAQSNGVVGRELALSSASNPVFMGRRGPAYPGGDMAFAFRTTTCNVGTLPVQWSPPMNDNHPFFAFLVVRERAGRLEQISDPDESFVKHGFAVGAAIDCGSPCQPSVIGLGPSCTDVYGPFTNSNRVWLGPADEVDPWLGSWDPVGSYFDRGDPEVAPPANTDGIYSLLLSGGTFPSDPVKNRLAVAEADLLAADTLYYAAQVIAAGEVGDRRGDNLGFGEFTAQWVAPGWVLSDVPTGSWQTGSVLEAWPGAQVTSARNGNDDGTFVVALAVTQLAPTSWRYDYAVHNVDNARGAAAFRVPLCSAAALTNVYFRDPNDDPLDEWTTSRSGGELAFLASATNPLDWNTIYNFGFETDIAPSAGHVTLDQARLGPGALAVLVPASVPASAPLAESYGSGCGQPVPGLLASGLPTIPQPAFALTLQSQPGSLLGLFVGLQPGTTNLAPGCDALVALPGLVTYGFAIADPSGRAALPFPIPNALAFDGLELYWQAARIAPLLPNGFELSRGLRLRLSCQ